MLASEKDFFISYTSTDRLWAEWIAWCLEQEGYGVIIQAWDFPAGSNFVYGMDQALKEAQRVIAVLSPAYLTSEYGFSEWAEAFRRDPQGKERQLLPVRIQSCEIAGLLGPIVYCDLVGCDEKMARSRLVAAARGTQDHPTHVAFPGQPSHSVAPPPRFPGGLPPIWNIPYPRNPFFTGRDEVLTRLSTALKTGQATALSQAQAISGLGGIGKTQIAVEYAYRHVRDYEAVFCVYADSRESLLSGYIAVAELLDLPQKSEQDQESIIKAVKNWLQTHGSWLLILDNADDLEMVREFVPSAFGGHILLTTRAQSMGRLAKYIEVETMSQNVGALFLLRRVGLIEASATLESASADDQALARSICNELGGLPLALDQAGAYIEESQCSLQDYQRRYQKRKVALLQRRGGLVGDHPEPVATTWSLSFQKVEKKSPLAADLLRLCAFLHPDAIAVELIIEGAPHLGPELAKISEDEMILDDAIAALGAYSLLRRNASVLSVHRLVQAVLRDTMDEQTRKQWTERAVMAVNEVFPRVEFVTWPQCERYLPHALVCAELIEQEQIDSLEAAGLLVRAGRYLQERARYAEAEPLYLSALEIYEEQLGADHPYTATSLDNLAQLYQNRGKYAEAEPLYLSALEIYEEQLGADHPYTATSLNNLAVLYDIWGKSEQAEPLYRRALEIREQKLGANHPGTAISLGTLAQLYIEQSKYAEAEPLLQRALTIFEQQLGTLHPYTANCLNDLARLYRGQGQYEQAEPLFKQALVIREQALGLEHLDTANSVWGLATIYETQQQYEEAERLYQRAFPIYEQTLGLKHPRTQNMRQQYVSLLRKLGRDDEAIALESQGQLPSEEY